MIVRGTRALVVEDETLVAMVTETFLEELGFQVVALASRLGDAIEKAQSTMIDIATLDINLAGQLSYPVAELLQSRAIPFVFTTGYGVLGLPPQFKHFQVVPKPFSKEQLAAGLRVACETR